jgi:hypothetical protein
MQQRDHPATGADQDLMHVVIVRRLVSYEDAVLVERAVGHEHVEVHVELEGRSEALYEGDGAA